MLRLSPDPRTPARLFHQPRTNPPPNALAGLEVPNGFESFGDAFCCRFSKHALEPGSPRIDFFATSLGNLFFFS